jgi:hypothetical protein
MFGDIPNPLIKDGSAIASAYSGGATMTNISPESQAEKSNLRRFVRLRILLVPLLNPFRCVVAIVRQVALGMNEVTKVEGPVEVLALDACAHGVSCP